MEAGSLPSGLHALHPVICSQAKEKEVHCLHHPKHFMSVLGVINGEDGYTSEDMLGLQKIQSLAPSINFLRSKIMWKNVIQDTANLSRPYWSRCTKGLTQYTASHGMLIWVSPFVTNEVKVVSMQFSNFIFKKILWYMGFNPMSL